MQREKLRSAKLPEEVCLGEAQLAYKLLKLIRRYGASFEVRSEMLYPSFRFSFVSWADRAMLLSEHGQPPM